MKTSGASLMEKEDNLTHFSRSLPSLLNKFNALN